MNPYIIVGGGLSGLFAARVFKDRNQTFLGLEKTGRLGGRAESGPHRVLRADTIQLFQKWIPEVDWELSEEEALERVKGEFVSLKENYLEAEKFYLHTTHFSPKTSFEKIVERLSGPVAENFLLNKTVIEIHGDKKTIELSDGTEQVYEKLFWCSDFSLLFKVWRGEPLHFPKSAKKAKENPAGFNLTLDLNAPLFETRNTVVFPFRFKEFKLRALGITDLNDAGLAHRLHWLVFLPKEIMEDREEVAKCVRTLKRELVKEFTDLNSKVTKERIVYLPLLSGEEPVPIGSLEVGPDIYYLGPQIQIGEEQIELKNIDLVAAQLNILTEKNLPLQS